MVAADGAYDLVSIQFKAEPPEWRMPMQEIMERAFPKSAQIPNWDHEIIRALLGREG